MIPARVDLSRFQNDGYRPGRGLIVRSLWYAVNVLFFLNPLMTSSSLKVGVLRLFGARIGRHVRLKPRINIKYPWNIELGDHVWIGEGVWLDSLGTIRLGDHVCVSQGAYLCTGNHDRRDPAFGLIVRPIDAEPGVWIGAFSVILPGVRLCEHAVITAGSVMISDAEPHAIYQGNPAQRTGERIIRQPMRDPGQAA